MHNSLQPPDIASSDQYCFNVLNNSHNYITIEHLLIYQLVVMIDFTIKDDDKHHSYKCSSKTLTFYNKHITYIYVYIILKFEH